MKSLSNSQKRIDFKFNICTFAKDNKMKSARIPNEKNIFSNSKKSESLKTLDENAVIKLTDILDEYESLISELENSAKPHNTTNEENENILKNLQIKQENEIALFLSQYKQKMIEVAFQEVIEQNEMLNKANEYKKSDDNMNYKKCFRMSIETGEEIIQRRINNQRKLLNEQYKKLLQTHENELKEKQNQIHIENRKNSKQLNAKINDLVLKRDMALLEVRTDYLNQWAKQYPNDDRFMMFKRFMTFFDPILQERGIPIPKTTSIYGKKGNGMTESNKAALKTMKKNSIINPI